MPSGFPRLRHLLAAIALASLCFSCRHRPPAGSPGTGWEVDCDLQVVSLPEELATPLAERLGDPQRVEAAFADLQKLIATKRAVLIGWPILTTKANQRAVVQQATEIRYWDEVPAKFRGPAPGQPKRPLPIWFETLNAGVFLVINSVTVTDDKTIQLSITAKDTRVLGWNEATLEKDSEHPKLTYQQPRSAPNGGDVSTTLRSGERKLIGTSNVQEPPGNVELFILRAEAQQK